MYQVLIVDDNATNLTLFRHLLKKIDYLEPLYGRIVAVADVFEVLTSPRPYKRVWTLEEACQFSKDNSSSHFDPQCVNAFFNVWDDVLDIHSRYQDEPSEVDRTMVHH